MATSVMSGTSLCKTFFIHVPQQSHNRTPLVAYLIPGTACLNVDTMGKTEFLDCLVAPSWKLAFRYKRCGNFVAMEAT